ncbi:MAG: response regulator [Planctomycetota bacterium]
MAELVWVIEDCPLTTTLIKVRLRSLGARAVCILSGRAAVSAWTAGEEPRPDVILIDLDLPGTNGFETGRMLRDTGYDGLLVLHTGPTSAALVADDLAPLFDDLLVKPVAKHDLARVLEAAASGRSRRAA